jgi:nicotinamidase-related amidase
MPGRFTEPARTALLVLHVQPPITDMPGADALLERIARAASAAREAGVEVMYVNIGFRIGYPEIGEDDPTRPYLLDRELLLAGVNNAVHEAVAPQEGEVEFTNFRSSAFTGSDLESILRVKDINHIVLTGITTSGVVMGTVTDADDRNYKITVLSDGVMDSDQVLHDGLLRVFVTPPRKARVITVNEWVDELADS